LAYTWIKKQFLDSWGGLRVRQGGKFDTKSISSRKNPCTDGKAGEQGGGIREVRELSKK